MTKFCRIAALPLLALAFAGVATPVLAKHHEATATASADAMKAEGEKLRTLFAASDEASLKRNPISALFRGDMRYADRLGDYISDAYYDAERKAGEDDLAALAKIDRSKLNPTDKIAYDVFKYQTERGLAGMTPDMLALTVVRPVNHFSGFHTFYPSFASGRGQAPFKTVADYDNNLKRHREYIALTDGAIERFRQGMKSGVVETKLTINNVIAQLDTMLAQPVEQSSFYMPATMIPAEFSEADKARIAKEYREMTEVGLYGAHRRLRDFLKNEYLPAARDSVGLSQMKGGAALYEKMIEDTTTLPLKAEEIHQLGLSEVARIRKEMDAIRVETGYKGTLAEFLAFVRDDPQFHPKSREWMTEQFYEIGKKVDALVPQQFSTLPKSKLEIRPYEEFREKYQAGGSYESGTPDGSRPGVFYFNAYDLPSRSVPGMTTLYLHEGAPGHHFQISLAQENDALPAFMRFGGNTAYVEGWALYAEKLGFDFGLYNDPYQRMGHLDDEMLRAMRLVVDTGLHAKGWGRDQAIAYMLENSSMGKTDATAEVERYIAIPTQALAYKIGALTIQRLKKKAQDAMGDRFDPRAFHDQVLMTGALPMTVLEKKIDDWIAASKHMH